MAKLLKEYKIYISIAGFVIETTYSYLFSSAPTFIKRYKLLIMDEEKSSTIEKSDLGYKATRDDKDLGIIGYV